MRTGELDEGVEEDDQDLENEANRPAEQVSDEEHHATDDVHEQVARAGADGGDDGAKGCVAGRRVIGVGFDRAIASPLAEAFRVLNESRMRSTLAASAPISS